MFFGFGARDMFELVQTLIKSRNLRGVQFIDRLSVLVRKYLIFDIQRSCKKDVPPTFCYFHGQNISELG